MKQTAIENGVELLAERRELKRIPNVKLGVQSPALGTSLRRSNCGLGKVNACGIQTHGCGHLRMLPSPATNIQNAAPQSARVGQGLKYRLRIAYLPGRRRLVGLVKVFLSPGMNRATQEYILARVDLTDSWHCHLDSSLLLYENTPISLVTE
jgi:hypothetical protein